MIVPVEISEDLLSRAEAAAKAGGVSFREFVSTSLESALANAKPGVVKPFVQRTHDFGTHLESPWTLLGEIESEGYLADVKK